VAEIEIVGLERLLQKIENLGQLKHVAAALKAGATHVKGKIAQYPPASEANMPGQARWYERGYGMRYASGRGKRTSETLGRKWTIASRDGGLTQVVGNDVSYGPYVQSAKFQARIHAKRGWKTDEQVLDEEQDTVANFVLDEVRKVLRK
jgi:hypothetical protein